MASGVGSVGRADKAKVFSGFISHDAWQPGLRPRPSPSDSDPCTADSAPFLSQVLREANDGRQDEVPGVVDAQEGGATAAPDPDGGQAQRPPVAAAADVAAPARRAFPVNELLELRKNNKGMGFKTLHAKLTEQDPSLEIGTKEVREMCQKIDKEQAAAAQILQAHCRGRKTRSLLSQQDPNMMIQPTTSPSGQQIFVPSAYSDTIIGVLKQHLTSDTILNFGGEQRVKIEDHMTGALEAAKLAFEGQQYEKVCAHQPEHHPHATTHAPPPTRPLRASDADRRLFAVRR